MTGFLDRMAARAAGAEHIVHLPVASRYAPLTTTVEMDDLPADVERPTAPAIRPVALRARKPGPEAAAAAVAVAARPSEVDRAPTASEPVRPTVPAAGPIPPAAGLESPPMAPEPVAPLRIQTSSPATPNGSELGRPGTRRPPVAPPAVISRRTARPADSPSAPRRPAPSAAPASPPGAVDPPADDPEPIVALPADLIEAHVLPELVEHGLVTADADVAGDGDAPPERQQPRQRPLVRIGQVHERPTGRTGIEVRIDRIEILPPAPPAPPAPPPPASPPATPPGTPYELPVVDHDAYLARRRVGR